MEHCQARIIHQSRASIAATRFPFILATTSGAWEARMPETYTKGAATSRQTTAPFASARGSGLPGTQIHSAAEGKERRRGDADLLPQLRYESRIETSHHCPGWPRDASVQHHHARAARSSFFCNDSCLISWPAMYDFQ